MVIPAGAAGFRTTVSCALKTLYRGGFRGLSFPIELESKFEADTREARSYRMWLEGLIAILVFVACLALDYLVVRDPAWHATVRRTAVAAPIALAVNLLMRMNPVRWLREGSVAGAMVCICLINLAVEGRATTTATLYGSICLLITAMFAGVVMRLRFRYTVASIAAMLLAGMWSLAHARTLHLSEAAVGDSLMVIGLGIILVASYSLEREERMSYLLCLQRDLQAEELEMSNAELQRLSCMDKLTGLPNRRSLEERFELMWRECALSHEPLSVVIVDIDHFKFVNDVYGHMHGDEALRRIGALLPQALRGASDMAARFGGEEFVLLLPHAERDVALIVAERVRQLVETVGTPLKTHPSGAMTVWTTVSCGVSTCVPGDVLSWADLLASADYALYAAKRAGRNRVEFRDCEEPRPVIMLDMQMAHEAPELHRFAQRQPMAAS